MCSPGGHGLRAYLRDPDAFFSPTGFPVLLKVVLSASCEITGDRTHRGGASVLINTGFLTASPRSHRWRTCPLARASICFCACGNLILITVVHADRYEDRSACRSRLIHSPCFIMMPRWREEEAAVTLCAKLERGTRFYACEPIPYRRACVCAHRCLVWKRQLPEVGGGGGGGAATDRLSHAELRHRHPGADAFYLRAVRMRNLSAVQRVSNEADRPRVAVENPA